MKSILLVEDDPETGKALARLFGLAHRVELVTDLMSVRERLTYGPRGRYDLVVTDWCFPAEPSGPVIDAAGSRTIAYAAQARTPCVVYSGSERPAGLDVAWVTKGDVEGLRKVVRKVVREILGDEP